MRWLGSAQYGEDAKVTFNRPIRWLLALLGDELIPFSYAGVVSGQEIAVGAGRVLQ